MDSVTEEDCVFFFYNLNGECVIRDFPSRGSETPLTLSSLEAALQQTCIQKAPPTQLTICCLKTNTWKPLDNDVIWPRFCQIIANTLPYLKICFVDHPHRFGDEKLRTLLEHLPPQIEELVLWILNGEIPLSMKQIGVSLPQLEVLEICGLHSSDCASIAESARVLAGTLRNLPRLRSVQLEQLTAENARRVWRPVFDVIQQNPLLETVTIGHPFYDIDESGKVEVLDWGSEDLDPLQFGPRLNKAKQMFLSTESLSLEDFVQALISVRDRIDCLDYLISQTDPNLYAWQALL